MGKMAKKIKKSTKINDPIVVLKTIANYRNSNIDDFVEVIDTLHLSSHTLDYLYSRAYDRVNRTSASNTQIKELSLALEKSYDNMVHGFTDRIYKLKKMADQIKENKSKKENEANRKRLTSSNGKIHELTPLDFSNPKYDDTEWRYENFRWFIDKLDEFTYYDGRDQMLFATGSILIKQLPYYSNLRTVSYAGSFEMNNHNHKINKDNMCKIVRASGKVSQIDPVETLMSYDLSRIINRYIEYDKTFTVGNKSYGFTKSDFEVFFPILCTFMAYHHGANSTFLEGKDTHPKLFEGITGLNFQTEHARMKLLSLIEHGKLSIEDNPDLMDILTNPIQNEDLLQKLCDKYNYNIRYFKGLYVELNEGSKPISTMEFKAQMDHFDEFVKL